MRWFIWAIVVLIIGVIAWFWYPRIFPSNTQDPLTFLPATTWAVAVIDEPSDHAILTDSNSLFRDMERLALIIDQVERLPKDETYILFLYGEQDQMNWGLITSLGLTDTSLVPELTERENFGDVKRFSTFLINSGIEQPATLRKLISVAEEKSLRMLMRPNALITSGLLNTGKLLAEVLHQQFDEEHWIAIDANESDHIIRMSGVEAKSASESDSAPLKNSTNILNYLPANIGAAIIESRDSMSIATSYCPYNSDDTLADQNIFITIEYNGDTNITLQSYQGYQGVPVSAALPALENLSYKPAWINSAYVAQLSSHVLLYAASFDQLAQVIDDYLADDKLTASPYYTSLEPYVSDGSFTLFIRPDLLTYDQPNIIAEAITAPINAMIYQSFEELPLQQFHSVTLLHHQEIKDLAPVAWSIRLDTLIEAGPWAFQNHYTGEREVLIQDKKHQLYLINKDGKVLWKRQMGAEIIKSIQVIDAFANNKLQMVFTTKAALHFVDRNGNEVKGFPVPLKSGASATPLCVRYDSKSDYRFIVNDGNTLVDIDPNGEAVEGWKEPELTAPLEQQVWYLRFNGKDYLIAQDKADHVFTFDRAGGKRGKSFQIDSTAMNLTLEMGDSYNSTHFTSYDSLGNIHRYDLNGKEEVINLLPLGSDVGFETIELNEYHYLSIQNDRFIALDEEKDVSLDYLLPEAIQPRIDLLSAEKKWVGLTSKTDNHYYILDLRGRVLDKMPLSGQSPALLIDLDQNGSMELVIDDGKGMLVAYKLAD